MLVICSYVLFFFFKQKTAYEIGLGIPAEPLFRSNIETNSHITGSFKRLTFSINRPQPIRTLKRVLRVVKDRKSGSAGMPRPRSYAVFCLKKKTSLRGKGTNITMALPINKASML